MNTFLLWTPWIGASLLLLAVTIESSSIVSAGASGRLGRLSASVILLIAAGAGLVLVLDVVWSRL